MVIQADAQRVSQELQRVSEENRALRLQLKQEREQKGAMLAARQQDRQQAIQALKKLAGLDQTGIAQVCDDMAAAGIKAAQTEAKPRLLK